MIYGSAQSAAALGLRTLNEEVEQASFLAKESVTEESRLNKDQESFSPALASPQRCYKDSGGKSVTMYQTSRTTDIYTFVCVFCVYVHGCFREDDDLLTKQNQSVDGERDLGSVKDTPTGEGVLHKLLFLTKYVDFVPKHSASYVIISPHHIHA